MPSMFKGYQGVVSDDEDDYVPPRRFKRAFTGLTPRELKTIDSTVPIEYRTTWQKYAVGEFKAKEEFQSEFVRHIETTLARSLYNCDELAAYQAASQAIRDRLVVAWNKTQQKHTIEDPKRVYYLSLEFLMGRALDNALLNLNVKSITGDGVSEFGFRLEDLIEQEKDAALGNGGLGRLAACFIDSLTSLNYPGWGYGLRYKYGIFKQKIVDGYQVEQPDYWLTFNNPWEIPRTEIAIDVMFYGYVRKTTTDEGKEKKIWEGGQIVQAVAYDLPVPGYGTENVNNLRLWSSEPSREFDFAKFNEGSYNEALREQQDAETISAVLYPNDNFTSGKELRLKQQYFWVSASLSDIVRRFKKAQRPWVEFPNQVAIQLNDTHPTLAIPELQRILVDLEGLEWDDAWSIVTKTFSYTNHTVLSEALETWSVGLIGKLLPRHLAIIYDINYRFLQHVSAKFPGDSGLVRDVSIIAEESDQKVRMAYLAIVGSHKVNGVARLHSDLIRETIFSRFVTVYGPEKFINVTNGVTPRRWLHQANPELSALIAEKLGGYEYLNDLDQLKGLLKYKDDPVFQAKWTDIKKTNKAKLAALVKSQTGIELNLDALFDIQVKRIHEYKRQQMNIFSVIHRYIKLKTLSPAELAKTQARVSIFGGKAAPGYYAAKNIIKLINAVSNVVNNDKSIDDKLKVVFIEDYNVSKAEIIIPASDLSEHISTAGTEASGTSNMKFVLNGGLIIGTVDGANIEITEQIGEDNIFLFGHLSEDVNGLRHAHFSGNASLDPELAKVFNAIESGLFGDQALYHDLINAIAGYGGDVYLVSDDFASYLEAHEKVDEAFSDKEAWAVKSITAVANMGFFSSDRAINDYAREIWEIEPVPLKE